MKALGAAFTIILFAGCTESIVAQVVSKATMDTMTFTHKGRMVIEGYLDTYYAYNFNNPPSKDQPYFVSMSRDKEVSINLAYINLKYNAPRVRASFAPGFGTYMNANYANEPGSLKYILEGSVGIRVSKARNIWIDAGVFGSPYTNESAISKDQLAYTRSFAPENVPYYLSGVKVNLPLNKKLNAYFYLLNGWQQIQDQNNTPAGGTQLEFRPNDNLLINWDTYVGQERSASDNHEGMRLFSDIYFIYSKGKLTATSCLYAGVQQQSGDQRAVWWQANLIARYRLTSAVSIIGRIEYFDDPGSALIVPITTVSGFSSGGASLGLNYRPAENILLRFESRSLFSGQEVYMRDGVVVNNSNTVTSNVTIWF